MSTWQEDLVQVYENGRIPPIADCRNPRCHDGGIDLNDLVWSVVHKKLTEFADSRRCKGHEANGSCDTRFKVKISVKYKYASAALNPSTRWTDSRHGTVVKTVETHRLAGQIRTDHAKS